MDKKRDQNKEQLKSIFMPFYFKKYPGNFSNFGKRAPRPQSTFDHLFHKNKKSTFIEIQFDTFTLCNNQRLDVHLPIYVTGRTIIFIVLAYWVWSINKCIINFTAFT